MPAVDCGSLPVPSDPSATPTNLDSWGEMPGVDYSPKSRLSRNGNRRGSSRVKKRSLGRILILGEYCWACVRRISSAVRVLDEIDFGCAAVYARPHEFSHGDSYGRESAHIRGAIARRRPAVNTAEHTARAPRVVRLWPATAGMLNAGLVKRRARRSDVGARRRRSSRTCTGMACAFGDGGRAPALGDTIFAIMRCTFQNELRLWAHHQDSRRDTICLGRSSSRLARSAQPV